jgi:hypothetical protein
VAAYSGIPGRLLLPEVAAAGLHHAAGVGLALQELSQNLVLLGHQLLHCGSWRRWRGNLLVMPATLPSCHMKTEIVTSVISIHQFERHAIISWKENCHKHNIKFEMKITWLQTSHRSQKFSRVTSIRGKYP